MDWMTSGCVTMNWNKLQESIFHIPSRSHLQYGQTYDERMRLGYAYPTPRVNFTDRANDSPFSGAGDTHRYGPQDNRYANHNYGPTSTTERNFGNYNDLNNNNNLNNAPFSMANDQFNYNNNNNNNYNDNPNPNVEFVNVNNRNRFENPYLSNQDRFNLNQGYLERQRYQQDRRYQQELEKLRNLLVETDQKGSQECTANVAAQWNFETNVNDYTQTEAVSSSEGTSDRQSVRNCNLNLIWNCGGLARDHCLGLRVLVFSLLINLRLTRMQLSNFLAMTNRQHAYSHTHETHTRTSTSCAEGLCLARFPGRHANVKVL